MFDKKVYYYRLKSRISDCEKAYSRALDDLETAFANINKGIIHGRKEQNVINTLKGVIGKFNKASFDLELAYHNFHSFMEHGVIKYE